MRWMGRRDFLTSGAAVTVAGMHGFGQQSEISGVQANHRSSIATARAMELIRDLSLVVLPKESGYIGSIGKSALEVEVEGKRLTAQSQNYYMLTRDRPINYLHWLASDDTHILIEGGPVDYFIFHDDGKVERKTLGMRLAEGQRPVVAVSAGSWKALRLHPEAEYALTANVLSPEFTPDRVRIGEGSGWMRRFVHKAPWATEGFLREMIGPNWQG